MVSYNFDSLLETVLTATGVQHIPIWNTAVKLEWRPTERLPIYHVHGFVPLEGEGAKEHEIVFSEEQYHAAAQNTYSWSSLVQIKYMTESVGLMVGLSMTDRNMRRLLDALRRSPISSRCYAVLQRPKWNTITAQDLEKIHEQAKEIRNQFPDGGIKSRDERFPVMEQILGRIEQFDLKQQEDMLLRLGVKPIWYEDHQEVAEILKMISQ